MYDVPARSSFFLSTIDAKSAETFSQAAYKALPHPSNSAGPGQFDFVLLDPPWGNRSVRRSKKYEILEGRREDSDPLLAMDGMLGKHIAPGGLAGCWITNKVKVREEALRLLESWGVVLEQEWVWLKVTTNGEPVTELDGLWRKPYEVLLLGRKVRGPKEALTTSGKIAREGITRRLIIAVPELHSRKPNLKELIEPMLPDPTDYRILEVFARNLTAGWWSWGDECLKYNWTGFWSSERSTRD